MDGKSVKFVFIDDDLKGELPDFVGDALESIQQYVNTIIYANHAADGKEAAHMPILHHTAPGIVDDLPEAARCHCPNPPAPSDVIDWTSANHYLNHGQWLYARTLANNTRLLRLEDGDIAVRLHSSEIVAYPCPGKGATVKARFSLAGYPTRTTTRRIVEHTGVLNMGLTGGQPSVLTRSHVLGDKLTWMGCTDNEVMAVTGAGHVVLGYPGPMLSTDFHPKAKRPYRTRARGSKHAVAHFTGPGSSHVDASLKNSNMGMYVQYAHYTSPGTSTTHPSSPSASKVDGDTVRSRLGQTIPDMGARIDGCPAPMDSLRSVDCDKPWTWTLSTLLIHLNDIHRWTREGIADWLESTDLDLEFRPPPTPDPPETYTPF